MQSADKSPMNSGTTKGSIRINSRFSNPSDALCMLLCPSNDVANSENLHLGQHEAVWSDTTPLRLISSGISIGDASIILTTSSLKKRNFLPLKISMNLLNLQLLLLRQIGQYSMKL